MKKLPVLIAAAAVIIIISASCQQVFTTNAYFWYEADITSMSNEQKVSYAEDLLSSGTATAADLAEAYEAVEALLPDDLSTADSDTVLLAADLAIGSSGIGDAVTDALALLAGGGDGSEDPVTEILGSIDTTNLSDAVALVAAAEDMEGVELTSEQYTNAAAAQLLVVIDEAGGIDNLGTVDPADEDLVQALEWAEAGGVDLESMLGDIVIPE